MLTTARTIIAAAILAATLFSSQPAAGKSLKDFNAMASADQSEYLISFLEKMIDDISQKNPGLGRDIKNYFFHKDKDKPFSEGMEKIFVELTALELQARDGKADLSKVQLESIVVWVVKQKFPPPWTDETKAAKPPA